jgi:multicomponent Na+:H+ antiporter subunit A
LGYVAHNVLRTRAWLPRFGTEDVYNSLFAALDHVSRTIAPPLHSASLRTYVMVIVVTAASIGGVALLFDPRLGTALPRTTITVHDLFIVCLIIGGAVAATLARSTISAVLALGAVGYGVALVFLTFGAPDLAMTQFSVETLTVVIYVLVFRHFRGLDELSSRLVRARDALIAIGGGTMIGGVLLAVATTETAPLLREYFAEFGPTLGHGRNIVNVILVDFRAFDTLGEITVLATAAIGVHGMLRFAADGRSDGDAVSAVSSPIFRTAARLLMPLILLFAVFLLLRGHNEPGGGFVGGLVAAAAFALYATAFGVARARQALIARPLTLLGAGLLIALVSGLPAVLRAQPFLTAQWLPGPLPLGTPALFDLGVFFVVTGVVLMMIFSLAEEP